MVCNELNENRESKWALWGCSKNIKVIGDTCLKSLANIFNKYRY